MSEMDVRINCRNMLGEGPIWHGDRNELIWFDILAGTLYRATADGTIVGEILFREPASAAAIIDHDRLAVVTASALLETNLETGERKPIVEIEADNPVTRGNDSRANPAGGFWIGTMGLRAEPEAGTIYQFMDGKLNVLFERFTVPNSICFAPDRRTAYYSDSRTRKIMKTGFDPVTGLPTGEGQVFVDLGDVPEVPDGSIVDSEGYLWNAQYGGGRVVRYAPDGSQDRVVELPATQATCPCLGGPELKTLFVTTAAQNLTEKQLMEQPQAGCVFAIEVDTPGQPESRLKY